MALGNPTVDYMSLDIEGAELPVLKTVPWDKVFLLKNVLGSTLCKKRLVLTILVPTSAT
jgi:hypothetical protein